MAGTRVAVVASFVLFVLLAAPLAWQLTRVERASLPAERIHRLASVLSPSNNASQEDATTPLSIAVYARGSAVVELPQTAGVAYERRRLMANPAAFPADEAQRQQVDDRLRDVVGRSTSPAAMSIVLLCPDEKTDGDEAPLVVGKHRHAWANECDLKRGSALFRAVERLVRDHLTYSERLANRGDDGGMARLALQYRLQFTLLKEDPSTPWTWNFSELSARYLQPLMRKVSIERTLVAVLVGLTDDYCCNDRPACSPTSQRSRRSRSTLGSRAISTTLMPTGPIRTSSSPPTISSTYVGLSTLLTIAWDGDAAARHHAMILSANSIAR